MSLGKGLGALITSTGPGRTRHVYETGNVNGGEKIWSVPLTDVFSDPGQPRKSFAPQELQELALSIKEHGILQPLLVVERDDSGYTLVAGERRLRAAKIAGLSTVPVIVKKLADQAKVEIALIENIQRENLNPIEEAFAYRRLSEEFGLIQEEIAKKVGKSRPAIANAVRLLELPEDVKNALVERKISAGQARALLGLSTQTEQLEMLSSMLGTKISVREMEREVRNKKAGAVLTVRKDANISYLEQQLSRALGTKAAITERGGKGQITIAFFSKTELGEIVKKITE